MTALRRAGLNLLYLVPGAVGGTEVYARELLRAMAAERPDVEFVAFAGAEAHARYAADAPPANVRWERVGVRSAAKPLRVAAELALLPGLARRAGVDVLHSLGATSPLHGRVPRVVTVNDLIYLRFPGSFPAPARAALRVLVPAGARRARRVITHSQATKDELVAEFGLDPARVDAVHLGLGMEPAAAPTPGTELRERYGLGSGDVVLCVAAALPHKNLERLVEAMDGLDARLVVAGHPGRIAERLRGERVTLTGWVSDADLEGLYGLAAAFAYPSLHEGFGLPVLEAMRRGVPVACSHAGSLAEVAGEAAEVFDPLDQGSIRAALARLLADPARRAELTAAGRLRCERFTWQRAARETLASYERALAA